MTPKEQEIAIGELEERVDRLRNLYEQYFLGFEKLEPSVPRKDVDRRFMLVRKEQIRNTAMRFRFNVVTQKFNTYAMHWVRICRQIEDGTYKRHIRKAKARFGEGVRPAESDVSFDIEVDMDEFESDDVDASVAGFAGSASDTVPPEAMPAPMVAGQAERGQAERAQRGVALPPGAKPRVMLRRREEPEPPPPSVPAPLPPPSARSMPIAPIVASGPSPLASSQRMAAARPALDIPGGRPSGPRIVRSAAAADSSTGVPAAAPSPAAPSAGRLPAASPSGGRLPLPAPLPPPSAGRLPLPAPPKGRPGMPIPPISAPRMPIASPVRPPGAEGSPSGDSRPNARPHAPLPLPSQARPTKKE